MQDTLLSILKIRYQAEDTHFSIFKIQIKIRYNLIYLGYNCSSLHQL